MTCVFLIVSKFSSVGFCSQGLIFLAFLVCLVMFLVVLIILLVFFVIVLGFLVFILNNPELVDEFATFWRELIANYFAGYLIWVVTLVTVFNIFIAF